MTSPSQPVNIRSPRSLATPLNDNIKNDSSPASLAGTPSAALLGTPDLRALRAGYAGTPPPPNIPLRGTPVPNRAAFASSSVSLIPSDASPGPRPGPQTVGGLSASRQPVSSDSAPPSTPPPGQAIDIDELPAEEKARVLGRHL